MTHPLICDDLQESFPRHIEPWPADRQQGPNTRYRLHDGALGACGIFLTPAPSVVDSPRPWQPHRGQQNAPPLWRGAQMPWENPRRTRRDPSPPTARDPGCVEVCARRAPPHRVAPLRTLGAPRLVALEGTNACASHGMQGHHWLTRPLSTGHPRSAQAAMTPLRVCPGQSQVRAWPPQDSRPQAGQATQDCEHAAGPRWLATPAAPVAPPGVPCLGEALSRHQPWWALVGPHRGHCILTGQPASPPTLSARCACGPAHDARATHAGHPGHGRGTAVTLGRDINDVLRRSGDETGSVHGGASTVVNATTGAPRSPQSGIPTHRLTVDHVGDVAHAGRGRGKIANAHHHGLQTKGDQLAHHCGHGQQDRAAVLLRLNLLAGLCHPVWEWRADRYALLRRVRARRQTFLNDIQAVMRSRVLDHGEHWMDCMLRGLELASQFDSS